MAETLTPEERYQLETIRLRHAADEDHMESGNSDGREWTFTAIGIHGQRGDLLHIIDRLNAAATCPASGALMAEADHFPDVKEMVPHPAAVGLLRTMWLHDNHRLSYRCNWAACLDAIEALEPELGKRARSGEELESILRSVGAIDP